MLLISSWARLRRCAPRAAALRMRACAQHLEHSGLCTLTLAAAAWLGSASQHPCGRSPAGLAKQQQQRSRDAAQHPTPSF
ncbi:hypothetical protein FA09DRAFT_332879 [Tilletiopsis washingtonensis]|uniref:Uncharacterized protein n=1 Tax=Tilletiopsis washingtonensis TaxID=58919 RepID=A0A316YZK8_9BASI|nr:hypothetical protein FA09DRAFT_332879 [Tilletiopsis washingtonensis]PWN94582.1 hypothetical protein FA09DRAFT_332879 [Tilletiopsis washingtonensis]